ncbi:MAG: ArsR/SmtB family transcription factor [Candidatus Hodarchaeota archaeon]
MTRLSELLVDPVRSRIYFEVLLKGEVTAQHLMDLVEVNRSTLSHHLTKMVESSVLQVRVESVGRPTKFYRLHKMLTEKIVLDKTKELGQHLAFTESTAAHLQLIANLAQGLASDRKALKYKKKQSQRICFAFQLLSEDGIRIWSEEHEKFMREVEKRLKGSEDVHKTAIDKRHIAFSGSVPIPES